MDQKIDDKTIKLSRYRRRVVGELVKKTLKKEKDRRERKRRFAVQRSLWCSIVFKDNAITDVTYAPPHRETANTDMYRQEHAEISDGTLEREEESNVR